MSPEWGGRRPRLAAVDHAATRDFKVSGLQGCGGSDKELAGGGAAASEENFKIARLEFARIYLAADLGRRCFGKKYWPQKAQKI